MGGIKFPKLHEVQQQEIRTKDEYFRSKEALGGPCLSGMQMLQKHVLDTFRHTKSFFLYKSKSSSDETKN